MLSTVVLIFEKSSIYEYNREYQKNKEAQRYFAGVYCKSSQYQSVGLPQDRGWRDGAYHRPPATDIERIGDRLVRINRQSRQSQYGRAKTLLPRRMRNDATIGNTVRTPTKRTKHIDKLFAARAGEKRQFHLVAYRCKNTNIEAIRRIRLSSKSLSIGDTIFLLPLLLVS